MCVQKQLHTIHFRCVSCDEWTVIETIGVVLEGPKCPTCRRPMKHIVLEQKVLDLFAPPTTDRT